MFVVILIYLSFLYISLPFAPYLVRLGRNFLGQKTILVDLYFIYVFAIATLTLLVSFFLSPLEWRLKKREGFLLGGLLAFSFSTLKSFSITSCERFHLFQYAILGVMAYLHFIKKDNYPFLKAFSLSLVAGGLDEIFQTFLPNRVGELKDVTLNIIGGIWGIMLARWFFLALRKNTLFNRSSLQNNS